MQKLILASLGAYLTNTEGSKGYITHSISKLNSALQGTEERSLLPLQIMASDDNEEPLAGAAAI